jgi:hypothetical protein
MMAGSGCSASNQCPLWVISGHCGQSARSALPPKADIDRSLSHVRFVPEADIPQRSDIFDEDRVVRVAIPKSHPWSSFDGVLDDFKLCRLGQAGTVLPARIKVARLRIGDLLLDQTNHVT